MEYVIKNTRPKDPFRRRVWVSPRRGKYSWGYGSWSSTYPTYKSDVLIYATDSSIKIKWLQEMGVTLDNVKRGYNGYKYAISVRKLMTYDDAPPHVQSLINSELDVMYDILKVFRTKWPISGYNSNDKAFARRSLKRNDYLMSQLDRLPYTRHAIEFAAKHFEGNAEALDDQTANYLVDPVTLTPIAYDIINMDFLEANPEYWKGLSVTAKQGKGR